MKVHAGFLIGCLLLPLPTPAGAVGGQDLEINTEASQVGFALRTRWGQSLEGDFPDYKGVLVAMPGGELQVRMVLHAREVEILGHPRYTRITRGEGFFHVRRWQEVELQSDPFPPQLLHQGGELSGIVGIRGLRRVELFTIAPATCDRPLFDCPVVAEGEVSRSDYGMDSWGIALGDGVRFHLRLWAHEPVVQ